MEIRISAPPEFRFKRTVLSHGWSSLPPFELDHENWVLSRVLDVGLSQPVSARISEADEGLHVEVRGSLSRKAAQEIARQVRHIFRLDDALGDFYSLLENEADFAWVASSGAGRMIRSPTVFEDLIKTICTTNCSWALTKKMVESLVESLGAPARNGRRTFPGPREMAACDETFYREQIRSGYRASYLQEVAEKVASGELDVEKWANSELPTGELKSEIKKIKGVGDYAAENLLKLLGRYDGLALDSWLRARFAELRNRNRKATDKKIERYYSRFHHWRGLVLWCDMTRDWIEVE